MFNKQTFWQLFRFGITGTTAALVNFFSVVLIVEYAHLQPLVANIFAFLLAFNVSYFGHRFWTFGHKSHGRESLPKFFTISITCFFLNEGLFALLLAKTQLHYTWALIITILIVAILSFVLSKLWAFK